MSRDGACFVTFCSGVVFFLLAYSTGNIRDQRYLAGVAQGLFSSSVVILCMRERS